MDWDEVEVHKDAKREQGQYPAILTEQAWSIKDSLYGIKSTEKMTFVLVYFRAPKRKPVICKSDNAFSVFSFSSSIRTEKPQKIFLLSREIFCERKLSCTRLNFGEMLSREQNGQSRAGSIVPSCRSGSQSQRGIWFILPARGACHIIRKVTMPRKCCESRSIVLSRKSRNMMVFAFCFLLEWYVNLLCLRRIDIPFREC